MDTILGLQHIGMPVNQIHETKEFYFESAFSVASVTMNGNEHVAFLRMRAAKNLREEPQCGVIKH